MSFYITEFTFCPVLCTSQCCVDSCDGAHRNRANYQGTPLWQSDSFGVKLYSKRLDAGRQSTVIAPCKFNSLFPLQMRCIDCPARCKQVYTRRDYTCSDVQFHTG